MIPEEEGRAAFEHLAVEANPYDRRSREGRAWDAGFRGGAESEPEPEVYVAIESGVVRVDGQDLIFTKDRTRVRAGHPLLRTHPNLFRPIAAHYANDIEQATAAPGEQRNR